MIRVWPMAWSIAHKLHGRYPGVNVDDIFGEVQLRFVWAAGVFDPSRGLKFSTLAYTAGWRAGKSFCLAKHNRPMASLDEIAATLGQTPGDLATAPAASDDPSTPCQWESWLAGLNDRTARVLRMRYIEDRTLAEIGAELRITKERVRQIAERGLERLRSLRPKLAELID